MKYLESVNWGALAAKVGSAILILLVTWIIARVVKSLLARVLKRVRVLNNRSADGSTTADSLASIASLLIWLFGLVALLNLFGFTAVLTPIQNLLDQVLGFIPNLLGAGLVFFFGLVLARIVRDLVVTALSTVNFDKYLSKATNKAQAAVSQGVDGEQAAPANRGAGITKAVGSILYAIILVVVSIAALQILNIKAISEPATAMLQMILNSLPVIIAACILLAIGVVIARFVSGLLVSVLRTAGVDNTLAKMGIKPKGRDASSIIGTLVQVIIVIFFAVAATRLLGFPEITAILDAILVLAGRIVVGAAVIAAGVFIADFISKMIGGSAANIVRYATIVLFIAMGLSFMGLAPTIINLAFGALVIGGAAAGALAFGLGGREAAARQLKELQDKKK